MDYYAQGMLYETARELISSKIGNVSHEIGLEERKPIPSEMRIRELEREIIALSRERESLDPEDEAAVRDVFRRYSRAPLTAFHLDE
jgi:hypothetical protein